MIACKKRITEQELQWEILSLGMKVLSVQVGLSDAYCLGPQEKKRNRQKTKERIWINRKIKTVFSCANKKAGWHQLNCESLTLLPER